jgi:hypothetical protein
LPPPPPAISSLQAWLRLRQSLPHNFLLRRRPRCRRRRRHRCRRRSSSSSNRRSRSRLQRPRQTPCARDLPMSRRRSRQPPPHCRLRRTLGLHFRLHFRLLRLTSRSLQRRAGAWHRPPRWQRDSSPRSHLRRAQRRPTCPKRPRRRPWCPRCSTRPAPRLSQPSQPLPQLLRVPTWWWLRASSLYRGQKEPDTVPRSTKPRRWRPASTKGRRPTLLSSSTKLRATPPRLACTPRAGAVVTKHRYPPQLGRTACTAKPSKAVDALRSALRPPHHSLSPTRLHTRPPPLRHPVRQ